MHRAVLVLLSLCFGACHSWVLPTSKKRSVPVVTPHYFLNSKMPSSRINTPTGILYSQEETSTLDDIPKTEDATRIRKFPFLRRLQRGFNKKRGISLSLAMVSAISLMPSAAQAALSSTTLSATAASTMAVRPNPNPWQWALVALLWVWQAASPDLLALTSQGLRATAAWYMMQLTANPVVTKSVTAGVIGAMGDWMAQSLEHTLSRRKNKPLEAPQKYDHRRGLSILMDGLFLSGPLMHFGYELFDRILPIHGSGAAILHVLADSIFLDAIFVATTYVVTGRMEGYSLRQVMRQLRKDYLPTLKASWATSMFLMPIEFICFRFLPLSYRVLAVNFIDVVWDAVISFMAHRNRHDEKVFDRGSTGPCASER